MATPLWTNSLGQTLSSITFLFSGFAKTTATQNVSSASVTIRLANATTYPATVSLVRPQSCTIGVTGVADNFVAIVFGGTAYSSNTNLSFANGANKTIAMRFLSTGSPGLLTGAVACSVPGYLRYTY